MRITNKDAEIIRAFRKEGYTFKQIAATMGISIHTAQRHASEAHAKAQRKRDNRTYARRKAKGGAEYEAYLVKARAKSKAYRDKVRDEEANTGLRDVLLDGVFSNPHDAHRIHP